MFRQMALALLLAACSKQAAPPERSAGAASADSKDGPRAPAAQGCDRDLSGMWRHASDASYSWHIADGKSKVEFHPMAGGSGSISPPAHEAGGAVDPSDPHAHHQPARDDQARITLLRQGASLAGSAESRSRTLDGSTECPVSFRAWALSCGESEIVLSMEQSYNVGADCKREASGGEPDMATHRLIRTP